MFSIFKSNYEWKMMDNFDKVKQFIVLRIHDDDAYVSYWKENVIEFE